MFSTQKRTPTMDDMVKADLDLICYSQKQIFPEEEERKDACQERQLHIPIGSLPWGCCVKSWRNS